MTNDPKEAATRALWKQDADAAAAKLKDPALSDAEREKLTAQQKTASAGQAARREREATSPTT